MISIKKLMLSVGIVATAIVIVDSTLALGPLTLTLGGTAYVLSATQTAIAAASIAGLAIAKEAIILNELKRRGKRDVDSNTNVVGSTPLEFVRYFDVIAETDVANCGKLLVCTSMAKKDDALTKEEKLVKKLFEGFGEEAFPESRFIEYQIAARAGSFKAPEFCVEQYPECPLTADDLSNLVKA